MMLWERARLSRLVNPTTTEMSVMALPPRPNSIKLANPASAEMSKMVLIPSSRSFRLVNPASAEMSEMLLLLRSRTIKLVAYSRPVKLLMFEPAALSSVNLAISPAVIVPPGAMPKADLIAARRLGSGMSTTLSASGVTLSPCGSFRLEANTSTPRLSRTGMCVSMDVEFRGFPFASTLSSNPNPVLATRGERSEMALWERSRQGILKDGLEIRFDRLDRLVSPASAEMSVMTLWERSRRVRLVNPASAEMSVMVLSLRYRISRLVSPASAEMSVMVLSLRYRNVRLVSPASAEMSEMALLRRSRLFRLVAYSRPVKLLMSELSASSSVNLAIRSAVIAPPGAMSKADSIAARRFGSGMSTACDVAVSGSARKITTKRETNKLLFIS